MLSLAAEIIFWICAGLMTWTYVLYPTAIVIIARLRPRPWISKPFHGKVSLIVAAHNEESVIRKKIENCLNLDFGLSDWEVIIVSDGSIDETNSILFEFSEISQRLQIITYHPRQGKANAINVGVSQANGEILIFTDPSIKTGNILSRNCSAAV